MAVPVVAFKRSDESKVYGVDFSSVLATGETISGIVLTSDTSGITLGTPSSSAGIVSFRASGGSADTVYGLTVQITTSAANIYENVVYITIQQSDVMTELLVMLRFTIGDVSTDQSYTDSRLTQTLCVAAKYVQRDLGVSTYSIDVAGGNILPIATLELDETFKALLVLRAGCFIDQSALRTGAATAGIRAALGPLSLDTSSATNVQGLLDVLKNGPCTAYTEALRQYMVGNLNIISAVLSPFTHNQFDPSQHYNSDPYFNQ